jgi:hypothetical protein
MDVYGHSFSLYDNLCYLLRNRAVESTVKYPQTLVYKAETVGQN